MTIKYDFNSASQIKLRELRKERSSLLDLVDGAHCASCGEHTHGGVCIYCFSDEAKCLNEIEQELAGLINPAIMGINLTQHEMTPNQIWDFPGFWFGTSEEEVAEIRDLLTFDNLPSKEEIGRQATRLAMIAKQRGATHALVGGAPYLMPQLHVELEKAGIVPVYSFTERKSVETNNPDGTVTKVQVFEHAGFIGL